MVKRYNLLKKPLNWIFSTPAHIALLRAVMETKEGMSGRAIAREAGINHQSCAVAIKNLEILGIVQRQGSGKTQLIRLNFNNSLVQELILPPLRKEKKLWQKIRSEITEEFKPFCVSATIFGSTARGQNILGSDLDLLLIVESNSKPKTLNEAHKFSSYFRERYGIRFSPIVLTIKEAQKKVKKLDPLLLNILKEGYDLYPNKFHNVIS